MGASPVPGTYWTPAWTLRRITKAAALVSAIAGAELPMSPGPNFPISPRLTVTEITVGNGYSAVPDLCTCHLYVRLTPELDTTSAESLLRSLPADLAALRPDPQLTSVEVAPR